MKDGAIDLAYGFFEIEKCEDGTQVLTAWCGAICELPAALAGQDWTIDHNLSFAKAALCTDLLRVEAKSLFEKAQVTLEVPHFVTAVVKALVQTVVESPEKKQATHTVSAQRQWISAWLN